MDNIREWIKSNKESLIYTAIVLVVLAALLIFLVAIGQGHWILTILSFLKKMLWVILGVAFVLLPALAGYLVPQFSNVLDNMLGEQRVPKIIRSAFIAVIGLAVAVIFVYGLDLVTANIPAFVEIYPGDVMALHELPFKQYGWLVWSLLSYGASWYLYRETHYGED